MRFADGRRRPLLISRQDGKRCTLRPLGAFQRLLFVAALQVTSASET